MHNSCLSPSLKNTEYHSGPDGLRTKRIEAILADRPTAFEPRVKKTKEGCRCKKSKCLKKYCVSGILLFIESMHMLCSFHMLQNCSSLYRRDRSATAMVWSAATFASA